LFSEAIADHKHVKTWIKSFLTSRNGRGEWIAFKAHYRGSNNVEAIEVNAEKIVDTVMHRGLKPRAKVETHVLLMQKAHMDIDRTTGVAVTKRTKVRKMLKTLQVTSMAVPIVTIRATNRLLIDFDATINYLRGVLHSIDTTENQQVAGVTAKRNKNRNQERNCIPDKSDKSKKESKGLDQYYQREEWFALDENVYNKKIKMWKKRNIATAKTDAKRDNEASQEEKEDESGTSQQTKRTKNAKISNNVYMVQTSEAPASDNTPDIENPIEVSAVAEEDSGDKTFQCELDSHADTCCVGNGVMIVSETKRTVKVTPLLQSLVIRIAN
jgi:hypothetical protein